MKCQVYELGQIEYGKAYRLQRQLHRMRIESIIPDVLLLLEHPPTLTIGKTGRTENILVPIKRLKQEGITLFFSDRGGDVTCHGPGQLVVYPIFSLKHRGKDVHRYVHNLEMVVIQTLKDFGISAARDPHHPGVWIGREEIAAIGLSIKKWVSMHGLALNVNSNLAHFSLIHPCGFTERKATSMARLLHREIPINEVISNFTHHFSTVFNITIAPGNLNHMRNLYEKSFPAMDQMEST
jgi:lipoate-protein ligase B